jgi:hypothetical protein
LKSVYLASGKQQSNKAIKQQSNKAKRRRHMVTIIPENERKLMSMETIKEEYDGKWVFMVKARRNPFFAVPVVIADSWWEDSDKGIYEALKSDVGNRPTMHLSLLRDVAEMLGQY